MLTVELSSKGFDESGQYANVREVIRALGRTFPRDEPSSIARTVALNGHKTDLIALVQQQTKDGPSAFQQMWGAVKSKQIAALDKKTLSPLSTDDFLSGVFDLGALNIWGSTTTPQLNFTRMANKTVVGWHDSTLDAASWFRLIKLEPNKAAALLCRFNPDNSAYDPRTSSSDETGPSDYKRLVREFEDVATDGVSRTLSQWHEVAHDRELKHHSWIDEYQQAINEIKQPEGMTTNQVGSIASRPFPRNEGKANVTTHKIRTNLLDAPIKKAIQKADSSDLAMVFVTLRELALGGDALPFTGAIEGSALCYTNDQNKTDKLSKSALGKRLKRLAKTL